LKKELEEGRIAIKLLLSEKNDQGKEIERLRFFIKRVESEREPLAKELEKSKTKHNKCKLTLAKYLRILQEIQNREKRANIAKKSISIGQIIHKRIGENFKQVWEDGDEVLQLKLQLKETIKEKESLEKIKRSKK